MGQSILSSRAIMGGFFQRYDAAVSGLVSALAMKFDSDQGSEEYGWLGQVPQMREWVGGRHAKGLRDNGFTIKNKTFESTLKIPLDDIRRDKTGQIMVRVGEMAEKGADLPLNLLTTLIEGGLSGQCYDGQFFFDTDHEEGNSGVQSNKITVDISALPVEFHGSTTAPSEQEMVQVILKGIQQILSFKDDQGDPMNRNAKEFVVVVPIPFWSASLAAATKATLAKGEDNLLKGAQMDIQVVAEPSLSWTDAIAVFAVDGSTKPFIHQVEEEITTSMLAEGSEYEHRYNAWEFGTKAIENMGYGMWQKGCHIQLV